MPDNTDKRLEGVGGWLAFLVIGLLVLTPLRGLSAFGQLSLLADNEGVNLPQMVYNIEVLKIALQVALAAAAGAKLYGSRHINTVPFVIVLLWLAGPILNALDFIAVSWLLHEQVVNGQRVGAMTASVLWAALWTVYLLQSKRVQNTYRFITTNEFEKLRGPDAA
ncbi:MAG: DUF2569 domain-containing protein [Pseudomonadota bacterium]|nr:DUF2569 domain-containing protein [Pseudomonadota bacterium]